MILVAALSVILVVALAGACFFAWLAVIIYTGQRRD